MATATTTVDGSPSTVLAAVTQHRAEYAAVDDWATVPGTGGELSLTACWVTPWSCAIAFPSCGVASTRAKYPYGGPA